MWLVSKGFPELEEILDWGTPQEEEEGGPNWWNLKLLQEEEENGEENFRKIPSSDHSDPSLWLKTKLSDQTHFTATISINQPAD